MDLDLCASHTLKNIVINSCAKKYTVNLGRGRPRKRHLNSSIGPTFECLKNVFLSKIFRLNFMVRVQNIFWKTEFQQKKKNNYFGWVKSLNSPGRSNIVGDLRSRVHVSYNLSWNDAPVGKLIFFFSRKMNRLWPPLCTHSSSVVNWRPRCG